MKSFLRMAIGALLLLCLSCSGGIVRSTRKAPTGQWIDIKIPFMVDGENRTAGVRAYFPAMYAARGGRTIVLLHNHRGSSRDWSANTDVRRYADEYSIVLVCPSMGATQYETNYYPETQTKWDAIPGGKWIVTVLVPFLREEYGIARERAVLGVAGIGTGARGALLVASGNPEMFGAAAGLSGYYDVSVLTRNQALASVYGSFADFKERWQRDDNIMELAFNLEKTPVFLAHGDRDTTVPIEQSRLLCIRLNHLQKRSGGGYVVEYREVRNKSHEWKLWSGVMADMLSFFNTQLKD
ncbi:MAG TPA: alpha/beta hydrolase-fold protein [Spirochaetota bacterium]|nr:alpha/beta hydrolase-fold protein [Spirochaetota bacterium]